MSQLRIDIATSIVEPGSLKLWWLGQAGFAFKNHAGTIVYLDPYLSDACERLHGFKRMSLSPIAAQEVQADVVVLTHEHTDHLDPDALPAIAANNARCRFAAPQGCVEGLAAAGVSADRQIVLTANSSCDVGGLVIHTAPADHGDLSPSALTLLLGFGGVKVLVSGDTSLRLGAWKRLLDLRPDVVLPCINGVFGNMGHIDAAMLVAQARPRFAIPCHFWMFAEQGNCDPMGFVYACKQLSPTVKAMLLKPGEGLVIASQA